MYEFECAANAELWEVPAALQQHQQNMKHYIHICNVRTVRTAGLQVRDFQVCHGVSENGIHHDSSTSQRGNLNGDTDD